MRRIICFVFLLFLMNTAKTQVLINEVCNTGDTAFLDEDSKIEDWIEFYNNTPSAVNLQGYSISRSEFGKPTKNWFFPNITIKPHGYRSVFCSDKNRTAFFDHWEVPIYANIQWKYFLGYSEPPSDWREVTFNDASWTSGQGGIGYGDGDDSTVITPTISLYMRKSFYIADTSKISTAALLLDFDDGIVAYLNGVEIARANVGVNGDHPTYNTYAYDEHEATMYQNGNFSGAWFVDPQILRTAIKPGVNVFSIQTHNYISGMNDLTCIPNLLIGVNDTAVTYFPFPANVHLHTNFNLSFTGQTLELKDPSGNIIDHQVISETHKNNSRGRFPDGSQNWCLFKTPSPDTSNIFSTCSSGYSSVPTFNLPAGFYNGTQQVSLTGNGSEIIRYTIDGSEPTATSTLYVSPIIVDSTKVIRARSFSTDPFILPGKTITNTYFINENITIPVISLSSDPRNLFDWNYGIYELGPNADPLNVPYFGANFWNGWERPSHIEYFDQNGNFGFESNTEAKIQGNFSKAWPQKGFTVSAKDNYEAEDINYQLFPSKPISKFKNFNIRNAGSDWNTCHMRDRLVQKTAQELTKIDIMDARPCVLFINGKYWGVYEIREKQDEHYIENNYNIDPEKIDFLEFDGSIIKGSNKPFLEMASFIGNNNMNLQANYDSVQNIIDIKNFCDYFITETYVINTDWLGPYTNNIKFWRTNNPPGKWRYMLWDTDLSLGFMQPMGEGGDTTNMLHRAMFPETSNPHSTMLNSLLDNTNFRNYFVNRYCDLLNTIYKPYHFSQKTNTLRDEVLPEMARHFDLWGGTSPFPQLVGRSSDIPSWEKNLDTMKMFMYSRPNIARNQILDEFSLVKPVNVGLNVVPENAGDIQINTIFPDSMPWEGVYFDGVPISITAKAKLGFKFLYWKSPNIISGSNLNSTIALNVNQNEPFTAYFEELEVDFNVYPNPFNSELFLNFELKNDMQVTINLYNALGQKTREIISSDSFQKAGPHEIKIDLKELSLANGIYFIKFTAGDFSKMLKIVKTN
ncbi:MAG: CotH kinase family protein [Bacteroidetes bacterium]|nr:CotH kinase family protein [Bacteroidota bacterium]